MHVITSVSTQKGLITAVVARDILWEMTIKPVKVTSFLSLSHLLKLATTGNKMVETLHFLRVKERKGTLFKCLIVLALEH